MTIDYVLLVSVVALPLLAALDAPVEARRAAALLFLAVAPGWGLLRAIGAEANTITAIASFALSTAFTIFTGIVVASLTNWGWGFSGWLVGSLTVPLLLLGILRSRKNRRRALTDTLFRFPSTSLRRVE